QRYANAGVKLLHAERLGEVVVRAGLQRAHLIGLLAHDRQDDDRNPGSSIEVWPTSSSTASTAPFMTRRPWSTIPLMRVSALNGISSTPPPLEFTLEPAPIAADATAPAGTGTGAGAAGSEPSKLDLTPPAISCQQSTAKCFLSRIACHPDEEPVGSARRLASRRAGPWAPLAGSLRAGQATKDLSSFS